MPAGDRKIPEPIVDPMTTAMALQRPMRRSSPGEAGAVIRRNYGVALPLARGRGDNSHSMPPLVAALIFWSAVLAAVVAQVMILRSTRRVLRTATPRSPALEWAFAIAPAIALAAILALSWRATMRPPPIEVELSAPVGPIGA